MKNIANLPKEFHEAKKNDPEYQKRIKEISKHQKKGGTHPIVKSHMKATKLAKKVKKMGS